MFFSVLVAEPMFEPLDIPLHRIELDLRSCTHGVAGINETIVHRNSQAASGRCITRILQWARRRSLVAVLE